MALIKCPECNREISEEAILCPQCGYPIADKIDEINAKKITEANQQIIDNADDDEEFIIVCNECGELNIIEKTYIYDNSYCSICGHEPIRVIMERSEWFLMSESEMDKTAQKYIDEVESSPNVDKEMFLKYGSISSNVLFYKDFMVYCPHCGEYTHKYEEFYYNNNICTYCGSEYVALDILA
ncbi:MAG: zinc ribbon domain-containing protein, partial [Christensenellaceae bacterium]